MSFEHLVHEKTPTSEDLSQTLGRKLEEGIKALILCGKKSKKNYQFNILSNGKLDMKAASDAVGEKCEFEAPEIILERFGLQVGGIPPFGSLLNLETFFDEAILSCEKVTFNCGLLTESICMRATDLVKLVQPKIDKFVEVLL